MTKQPAQVSLSGSPMHPVPPTVAAVVLTHRRPRLATTVVRSLVDQEGLAPERVVVVVNGSGGLEDPELEERVRMIRLGRNLGPAGGFATGMEAAFDDPLTRWVYLCEDDVGLYSLPCPRLADVVRRAECLVAADGTRIGAVVAYGRRFVGRGVHTLNHVPPEGIPYELVPRRRGELGSDAVGTTGVRRRHRARPGVVLRPGGLRLLLSGPTKGGSKYWSMPSRPGRWPTSRRRSGGPAHRSQTVRRTNTRSGGSTTTFAIPSKWCGGTETPRGIRGNWPMRPGISSRRAGGRSASAIVRGLWDGARGRRGEHPSYGRSVGEWSDDDGR